MKHFDLRRRPRGQAASASLRAVTASRARVAPNSNGAKDNPAGRAKNRRVTISYAKG
jgi:outer membrane protein OmpA-like peptidoglycan-associated protein